MSMEKMIMDLIDAMEDLAEGKETPQRQVLKGESFVAKLVIDKGSIDFSIRATGHGKTYRAKRTVRVSDELQIKQAQCVQIREDFHRYIATLDKNLFNIVCKHFKPGQLKAINDNVENNNTDPNLMAETIDMFKKTVDKVIMDTVTRLKSQMTSFPQH